MARKSKGEKSEIRDRGLEKRTRGKGGLNNCYGFVNGGMANGKQNWKRWRTRRKRRKRRGRRNH